MNLLLGDNKMATRSRIILVKEDKIESIYVHWDGNPSTRLPILNKNYNTVEKVQQLVNLGDLSSIGSDIVSDVEWCDGRDVCVPYSTRGDSCPKKVTSIQNLEWLEKRSKCGEEYTYTFKDGKWYYRIVKY
jgi:hypothetical protein